MKVGKILIAAALVLGACGVFANAGTIKSQFFDTTPPEPARKVSNVTMVANKHRLMHLKNSVAKHETPDAIVYIPAGYDPDGPLNILLYNHGLTNNLDDAFEFWQLDRAMTNAPKNTVMILPEWAYDPKAYSSAAGQFHKPGFFRNMLAEILWRTPELQNKSVADIRNITIATFSGGFRASQTQIERNGLEDKVVGLVLLDSLYESNFFDNWLRKNIRELAAGRKFYQNFYFDTAANSMSQLARLRKMVADAGLPQSVIYHDKDHPKELIQANVIAQHPICYIYTTMYDDKYSAHQSAAYLYFPESLKAIAMNDRDTQLAAREQQATNEIQ